MITAKQNETKRHTHPHNATMKIIRKRLKTRENEKKA